MGSGFKQRGKCDRVFRLEFMSIEFILFKGMCLKANGHLLDGISYLIPLRTSSVQDALNFGYWSLTYMLESL